MNKLLTLTLLTVLSSASAAGTLAPFGIPFTATADDLRKMGATFDSKIKYWTLTTPPQPNPEFDRYRVALSPSGRICSIHGSGRTITSSEDGAAVKAQFNKLKTVLTSKYGPSDDYDNLNSGSKLTGKTDWMAALDKGERSLDSFWDADSGSSLPDNVSQIFLSALALSSTEGWVSVFYKVTGYDACTKETSTTPASGTGL